MCSAQFSRLPSTPSAGWYSNGQVVSADQALVSAIDCAIASTAHRDATSPAS